MSITYTLSFLVSPLKLFHWVISEHEKVKSSFLVSVKVALVYNNKPSDKVYQGTRSNYLFTVLLLISFLMCLVAVGWGVTRWVVGVIMIIFCSNNHNRPSWRWLSHQCHIWKCVPCEVPFIKIKLILTQMVLHMRTSLQPEAQGNMEIAFWFY